MLTRLELIGFKSFADKTRLEFAHGITAVVGPNGSGKSNIVDAVKWVLGEQSAKSLRGSEMADVIFNGSSTRKSLGLAEVTMTFDNRLRTFHDGSRRPLDTDAEEVQIARRVYRDGQSEYLLNGQIARLKDIKALFLGSGAGQGAYSVIEQGRVDALLTASTTDRRQIFEEAAGISKFKAKKVETLRKLERVHADLTRVRDILQEMEKSLRTLRLQAAKAQHYQAYSAELKTLHVNRSVREYRELATTLEAEEAILKRLSAEVSAVMSDEQAVEMALHQLETQAAELNAQIRHQESAQADARQRIAVQASTSLAEQQQEERNETEARRLDVQLAILKMRQKVLESEFQESSQLYRELEQRAQREADLVVATQTALNTATARIRQLVSTIQLLRAQQFDQARETSRLQSETEIRRRDGERLRRELQSKFQERDRQSQRRGTIETILLELSRSDSEIQQQLQNARQSLSGHVTYREELRTRADQLQMELDALRESRSTLRGRVEVLEGLEQSLEGIGAGVRAVLARKQADRTALSGLIGLVAEILEAPRDVAPLIDLALGDAAQRFVIAPETDWPGLLAALEPLPGRVSLLPLLTIETQQPRELPHGIVSAVGLVTVNRAECSGLPWQLLRDLYLVADLETARLWMPNQPHVRCLTRKGELCEADGTVSIGPILSNSGILSRKSELRELRIEIIRQDEQIITVEARQSSYRKQAEALDAPVRGLEEEIAALSGEVGTLQTQMRDLRQEQERLQGVLELLRVETRHLEMELKSLETEWQQRQHEWQSSQQREVELAEQLSLGESELKVAERDREQKQVEQTAVQVSASRVQTESAGLRAKCEDLAHELELQHHERGNLEQTGAEIRQRIADNRMLQLRASAITATAYLVKEQAEHQLQFFRAEVQRQDAQRTEVQQRLKSIREQWNSERDQVHAHDLVVRDLQFRRDSLCKKMREDYALELVELAANAIEQPTLESPPALAEAGEPELEEMAELKKKIAKLGHVNLEAMELLNETEQRETDLRTQHDDLTDSHDKLVEIITQINADSRHLFVETLATVRGHFQELFRKLFGGGMADIELEAGLDPLEAGIDVTARPPGKELRSLSLLSGGERTLTAVALLLAIFRSRPSPFCILDEVDAALDEANTARLAGALREFLDQSQFIIITHKKRTMALADVILGITMQESGVSKPISVRFEDWPEDERQATAA